MSVEYFLSDHLGSTSTTTDNAGAKVSEMRYKPWGEVRYSWTATQTTTPAYELSRYTFTGQYSYMDDPSTSGVTEGFGLMFYNARWYDPYLARFAQADTMIPQSQGVQAWDRYAYVNNSPVNFVDPTGHVCSDPDDPTPSCDGSLLQKTKVGNQMIQGGTMKGAKVKAKGGGGGNEGAGGSGNVETCSVGHCYETTNTVCPAVFNCTEEEMQEYAAMFQYPGQMPWNPVQNGYLYFVFPATFLASQTGNPLLLLSGAINVEISDNGLTLINQSEPTHIFHNGKVERSYTQNADGSWSVTSTGTGTNVWPVVGPTIDQANDLIGAPTFDIVDGLMMTYIYLDQTLFNP